MDESPCTIPSGPGFCTVACGVGTLTLASARVPTSSHSECQNEHLCATLLKMELQGRVWTGS